MERRSFIASIFALFGIGATAKASENMKSQVFQDAKIQEEIPKLSSDIGQSFTSTSTSGTSYFFDFSCNDRRQTWNSFTSH